MVGVLIIAAAGLLGILLIARSQVNLRSAAKSLDSVNSYYGFISGFTDFVQASVTQNIDSLCAGQLAPLTALKFSGEDAAFSTSLQVTGPQASPLKDRCKQPLLAADGRMYFCLQLDQNSAFAPDSFGGAEANIAEIAIRTVNKWQQPISCLAFRNAANSEAALQIYYRLHWATKNQPHQLHQKYGFYHAIKE